MVLAVALLLVVGVARLLGAGSDASSEASGQATTVSAEQTPDATESSSSSSSSPSSSAPSAPASPSESATSRKPRSKRTLAAPTGGCVASDITVEPVVRKATADSDVSIRLRMSTEDAEACTWEVSPETVTMKITSGPDDIWFSSECPREIPTQDVVLRSAKAIAVEVVWDARRSDEDCSRYTGWALPGDYHVIAAALGGEPTDVQFSLEQAISETITKTVTPSPKPKRSADDSDDSDSSDAGSGRGERSQHRAGDDGEGNSEG